MLTMKFDQKKIKIAILGLGYVGLPLSVAFCKKYPVIGYDLNKNRINKLNKGYDQNLEISEKQLLSLKNISFSSQYSVIGSSKCLYCNGSYPC